MSIDELADQLYRILKQHSDAENGPYVSERKNAGAEDDYVTIDGHLALRLFAADILRAMESVV